MKFTTVGPEGARNLLREKQRRNRMAAKELRLQFQEHASISIDFAFSDESTQPPAPQSGAGVNLCDPVQIASNMPDGARISLSLSTAGMDRLRDWAQVGENVGFVGIMPQGSASFYSSEAENIAYRPRLAISILPATGVRDWTVW